MKATEQYFPVVLFIMLYKVVLTFESVDQILKCDHSKQSSSPVLSAGIICFPVSLKINFRIFREFDFGRPLGDIELIQYSTLQFLLGISGCYPG